MSPHADSFHRSPSKFYCHQISNKAEVGVFDRSPPHQQSALPSENTVTSTATIHFSSLRILFQNPWLFLFEASHVSLTLPVAAIQPLFAGQKTFLFVIIMYSPQKAIQYSSLTSIDMLFHCIAAEPMGPSLVALLMCYDIPHLKIVIHDSLLLNVPVSPSPSTLPLPPSSPTQPLSAPLCQPPTPSPHSQPHTPSPHSQPWHLTPTSFTQPPVPSSLTDQQPLIAFSQPSMLSSTTSQSDQTSPASSSSLIEPYQSALLLPSHTKPLISPPPHTKSIMPTEVQIPHSSATNQLPSPPSIIEWEASSIASLDFDKTSTEMESSTEHLLSSQHFKGKPRKPHKTRAPKIVPCASLSESGSSELLPQVESRWHKTKKGVKKLRTKSGRRIRGLFSLVGAMIQPRRLIPVILAIIDFLNQTCHFSVLIFI